MEQLSLCTTSEPVLHERSHHKEKPALQPESSPGSLQLEESPYSNKDPAEPKIHTIIYFKKTQLWKKELNQNQHVIDKNVNLNLQKDNHIFCSWKYMRSVHNTICKENRSIEESLTLKLSPSLPWLYPLEIGIIIPFTTILDPAKVWGGKWSWENNLITHASSTSTNKCFWIVGIRC